MDRKELKELGISDELIDKVMALHGVSIGKEVAKTAGVQQQLDTEKQKVTDLTGQLSQRDQDLADLQSKAGNSEELNNQLAALKSKYEEDTKGLQAKLDSQAQDYAIEKLFEGVKFTSTLAKNAAMAEFKKKELKFSEGKFLGGNEYLEELKKTDPTAFVVDEPNPAQPPEPNPKEPKPQFVAPTQPNPNPGAASPFSFNFHGVRAKDNSKT